MSVKIEKEQKGTILTLCVGGRLDTLTSPELEAVLKESLKGVTELVLDLENLQYTSSAGLRVILQAQKIMERQGHMRVIHVSDDIMELFDITGFTSVLTIE